jgi:signal transduction histidine kinase
MNSQNIDALLQRTAELEKELAAKNRELQIEAALDRVRTRAMAMKHSNELKDLIVTVSVELAQLDFVLDRSFIIIFEPETKGMTWWMANPEMPTEPMNLFIQYHEQPPFLAHLKAWEDRDLQWQYILEGEVKRTWDQFLFTETGLSQLPGDVAQNMQSKTKVYLSASFNNFGALTIATLTPLSQPQFNVLLRFANVFDQTYTRFNDLKQAEAQAREAQIEAALERVRARTMAMQKSDELDETNMLVLQQLEALDILLSGIGIHIGYADRPESEAWMWDTLSGKVPRVTYNHTHDRLSERIYEGWKNGESLYVEEVKGERLKEHLSYISSLLNDSTIYEDSTLSFVFHIVYFTYGFFVFATPAQCPTEHPVFIRFAKVFEQTYTRFLDLQKAEAQAREAQIEAAVERIRSKALTMYKSEDILEVVLRLRQELVALNIGGLTAATVLLQQDNGHIRLLDITVADIAEDAIRSSWDFEFCLEDMADQVYYKRVWNEKAAYFIVEQVEDEIWAFIHWLENFRKEDAEEIRLVVKNYNILHTWHPGVRLEKGKLCVDLMEPPAAEIEHILVKIGNAFDLAYRRFLDLQNAETRAKEAQIEAALERVRSRTMTMQKSEELGEVIQVIFEQLCGLHFKIDSASFVVEINETNDLRNWLAAPGRTYASRIDVPYLHHPIFDRFIEAKEKGETFYTLQLTKEEKDAFFDYYLGFAPIPEDRKKIIYNSEGWAQSAVLMKTIGLNITNYVGLPYSDEQNKTLVRFGVAFEQTYIRFLDLKQAEAQAVRAEQDLVEIKAARKKAEGALAALKATQQQLIQKEKMASLGELTAGIAHEIQNPLNFVNNFTEISKELVQELKTEADSGNLLEVKVLAADILSNLDKVSHHGWRADNIVKSMLQHSRGTTGDRQPTDINQLVEEHLRLAYHGYRAKDQSFNVDVSTSYDSSVGTANIAPHEIGRVLLNLLNNAFYAVSEKKRQQNGEYEPIISVRTMRKNDSVEITVKDNGTGMSPKVAAKIFQPFFTTKPTGEGTGLGLSLSYDIITKGHGGILTVQSQEGEGSEFVVQLSTNS